MCPDVLNYTTPSNFFQITLSSITLIYQLYILNTRLIIFSCQVLVLL